MKKSKIIKFLSEVLSVIIVIVFVIFVFLSLGVGFIFLDSFVKTENEYDDWYLMEKWKQEKGGKK